MAGAAHGGGCCDYIRMDYFFRFLSKLRSAAKSKTTKTMMPAVARSCMMIANIASIVEAPAVFAFLAQQNDEKTRERMKIENKIQKTQPPLQPKITLKISKRAEIAARGHDIAWVLYFPSKNSLKPLGM